jgi:hypothetical protein
MNMKTNIASLAALLACLAAPLNAVAAEKEHHEEEGDRIEAPNGGRVVYSVEPHLEFYLQEDRTVKITFLDDDGNTVAPAKQSISLIGGDRANPTRLSFAQTGESLVSDKALPEGNLLPIILNIKENPGAKTIRERFNLNLSTCPECSLKEYACICGHEEGHHDDH